MLITVALDMYILVEGQPTIMGRFEWKLDVPNPRQDLAYVSSFDLRAFVMY